LIRDLFNGEFLSLLPALAGRNLANVHSDNVSISFISRQEHAINLADILVDVLRADDDRAVVESDDSAAHSLAGASAGTTAVVDS
jgi:hypothetical protein